jgi:Pentapeptide repeats (8 copies)
VTSGPKAVEDNAALIGALVGLGGVFTTQLVNSALEDRRAQVARDTEQAQRKRELEIGRQRSQDDALQAYFDQMSQLLLDKDRPLGQPQQWDAVQTLARTLTALTRLDAGRKPSILQFLYESGLVTKGRVVVGLRGADLRGAELSTANLPEADLSWANLHEANLSRASLAETDLREASLREADLREAYLKEADLSTANLTGATLSRAYLRGADLTGVELTGANLREAYLKGVTHITNEELKRKARTLERATMPNSQKYED